MVKSRDRHGRGLRGRLAWPNPYTGTAVPLRARLDPERFFTACVTGAVAQINESCPRALVSVDVAVEEVPTVETWEVEHVPLAAALEPTVTTHGQIVLFRRPLERRADTRAGLKQLVFATLVEQLTSITGIAIDEIDPDGRRDRGL